MKHFILSIPIVTSLMLSSAHAATYTTTFVESGGNVIANGSGSFDLAGMAFLTSGDNEQRIISSSDFFLFGLGGFDAYDLAMTGPASFGTGGQVFATSTSGDQVGIWADVSRIYVPQGYVSLDALSNSASWVGSTLADLGLSMGTYDYSFGNNTYSIVVGDSVPTVPLPASVPLLLAALGSFGLMRRGKKV